MKEEEDKLECFIEDLHNNIGFDRVMASWAPWLSVWLNR